MSYLAAFEKFVLDEWEVLSGAPTHFILAVALLGMVIVLGAKVFFRQQIEALKARRELAHDQAEAAEKIGQDLQQKLEVSIAELKEAQKVIERDPDVSSDVTTAVSAAVISVQDVMETSDVLLADVKEVISDYILRDDVIAAHAAADVLSGADLERITDKGKGKPRSKSKD